MKDKLKNWKTYIPILYWIVVIALLGLYFTNDFGIVNIHKTAVVVAVGIDTAEDEVQVTAQVAIPQPSQSGENIQYIQVQGSGLTVADALNEINAKTGTYPKLLFCKLILIGEDCQSKELFQIIGCFYRRNYSELTALVAMCKGRAQEMLAMPATISPENSTAIQKVLSDELKKSANVSSATLKSIAETNYSVSSACYMPYIEANIQGTSETGGNGDSIGGESAEGGSNGGQSGEGGGSSGQSGGGSGGSSGGEGGGGSSQSQSSSEQQMEFTARKTAIFSGGKFAGILDESQSFALNILTNKIRLAVVPADAEGIHYTVGLKETSGGAKLKVKDGVPELILNFEASAQIQGAKVTMQPESVIYDDVVKPEVLKAVEEEIKRRLGELVKACVEADCDVLGAKDLLHKYNHKYFDAFRDDLLSRMKINYKIKVKSLN